MNEKGVLEMETEKLPPTANDKNTTFEAVQSPSSTPIASSNKITQTKTTNNNDVFCQTPTSSRNNDKNNNLFKPSTSSSPIPNTFSNNNKDSKQKTSEYLSPSSSLCSSFIKNVFTPISCSPVSDAKLMLNTATCTSPSSEKHLYFPKASTSKQLTTKIKAPSAISALAWREHMQNKDNEKAAKAEAFTRKEERQKRNKRTSQKKLKKVNKNKSVVPAPKIWTPTPRMISSKV